MRSLNRCLRRVKAAGPLRDWEEEWPDCRRKSSWPPLRCYGCCSSERFFSRWGDSGMEL